MKEIRNKLGGFALILIGIATAIVSEGDITAFILFGLLGIEIMFAKENWFC